MKMDLAKTLAKDAAKHGICTEWFNELKALTDRRAMVEMYLRGIDFCLKNDYPTNQFIQANFGDIAPEMGVFVNKNLGINNQVNNPKCVCLGSTFGGISYNDYNVGEVFIKHDSNVFIHASDNAFVMVDIFDDGNVHIIAHDHAKVVINKYGNAEDNIHVDHCDDTAHIKIRVKNKITY